MNFSFFIAKRIAFAKKKTFSRVIIRIAAAAIALSLIVMIMATALVRGFQNEISEKVFGFWGHIHIINQDLNFSFENVPIDSRPELFAAIDTVEGVRHIQQFATKPGIITVNDEIEGIVIKGIAEDFDWNFMGRYIEEGRQIDLSDTLSKDILVSATTASRLQLKTGDPLVITFWDPLLNRIRRKSFEVSGIYDTGLEEFDKQFALVDLRQIRSLNHWRDDQIGGYEIFIKDINRLDELNNSIYEMEAFPASLYATTIKQLQPNIFDWLELQNTNETVILTLMIIVAVINMITALLILILERTNMIGILKSVGATNWQVRSIFLYNAAIIILSGLFIGNLVGIGLCLAQEWFHIIKLPEETYYVSVAPVDIDIVNILLINAGTLGVTLLALLLPSYLVTRISPIRAIRFK